MPTYTYECTKCNLISEIRLSIKDDPKLICDSCHSDLNRIIVSAPSVSLGWNSQAAGNHSKYCLLYTSDAADE